MACTYLGKEANSLSPMMSSSIGESQIHINIVAVLLTPLDFTATRHNFLSKIYLLTDRTQCVSLSNHCSVFAHVRTGVHQGSVLDPMHFSI